MAKLKKDKQLLVEGNDDKHVLFALCEQYNIPETFDIVDCEGIDNLLLSIPVKLKQSGIDTIGIILDADTDLNSRWQQLKSIFSKVGYSFPATIPVTGLIYRATDKVTIGIWIMPNNSTNGMLEDFIKFLVPNNDKLMPIAEETLSNIEMQGLNKYQTIHKSKALIHTWLAWQEDPGTPMGLSITKKYLEPNVQECTIFVDWLNKLFT